MLYQLLDQLTNNVGSSLGEFMYFMLELASFSGIFILLWGLVSGLVLNKWKYSDFLLGIIILGVVGPGPAWTLMTQGFPDFSSMFNLNGILPPG